MTIMYRLRNFSTISNKRITRIESALEIQDPKVESRLLNRNPRNLENLSYEKKPSGFWLEKAPPLAWNQLIFKSIGRRLNAYLQHWSGRVLVEATTKEPSLSKYLTSPNNIQAAKLLAQVLARRCIQSGYSSAGITQDDGIKNKVFYEEVKANGVNLSELPDIKSRSTTDL